MSCLCSISLEMHVAGGRQDEYSLVEALRAGAIGKPVVAWVSGTCATLFKSEVQFGHAGAKSGGALESAQVRPGCIRALKLTEGQSRTGTRLLVDGQHI